MDVLLVEVVYLFFEFLDPEVVLIVECFLGLPHLLDGLRPAFFFVADLPVHICQLDLLLLHGFEPFEDAHDAEVVHVDWPEVIREIADVLQKFLIDHVLANGHAEFFEMQLFVPQFLFFLLYLLPSLRVPQLKLLLLLIVGLLLAVVGEDLLLLLLELFSRLQLPIHELLLLQGQLRQRLLHVLLLGEILRLYFSLLLLDLEQLGVLGLSLKPD